MSRPIATVSVDLDSAATHLAGYGVAHEGDDDLLAIAVERLAEILRAHGIQATFFAVGHDAQATAPLLRGLVAAGHEVASHSFSHPGGFSRLGSAELDHELRAARETLEHVVERPVLGFRAPSWDVTHRVLHAAAAAGYRYDASLLPTPWQVAARLAVAAKGRSLGALRNAALIPMSLRTRPHARAGIVEFPVSVSRRIRWPLYHTTRYGIERARFSAAIDALARAGMPLSYALHAIDAVGIAEDGIDERLARHPGGGLPLDEKLALLEDTLRVIRGRYEACTFAARLRP